MNLEKVRALDATDQVTFLTGRVVRETLALEVVGRFLHALLHDRRGFGDGLLAPMNFRVTLDECKKKVENRADLDNGSRQALLNALTDADILYERRNRVIHDMLRQELLQTDRWERVPLTMPKDVSKDFIPGEPKPIHTDELVSLVMDLVRAKLRLRGGLWLFIGTGEPNQLLLGPLDPPWEEEETKLQRF